LIILTHGDESIWKKPIRKTVGKYKDCTQLPKWCIPEYSGYAAYDERSFHGKGDEGFYQQVNINLTH